MSNENDTIKSGFIIRKGDEINSFLVAALRTLNQEQMIVLRDSLIARTPKDDKVDKAIEWCDGKMNNTGFSSNEFANGRSNAFEEMKQYLKTLK